MGRGRPSILVSNDDGVHAPGLVALARALRGLGAVYVVAPDRERSTVGHALTLHRPLRVETLGPRRYAVNGMPSGCMNLGILGILPIRPDVVVAGINHGLNLGDDFGPAASRASSRSWSSGTACRPTPAQRERPGRGGEGDPIHPARAAGLQ